MQGGVLTERCYGCGRCFPVCPYDKISNCYAASVPFYAGHFPRICRIPPHITYEIKMNFTVSILACITNSTHLCKLFKVWFHT